MAVPYVREWLSSYLCVSQYLFPDAAVDKSSSENSESKASQLNTDGKPEEKESDDYVCLPSISISLSF